MKFSKYLALTSLILFVLMLNLISTSAQTKEETKNSFADVNIGYAYDKDYYSIRVYQLVFAIMVWFMKMFIFLPILI